MIEIPLRNRRREIVAVTIIDDCDAHLVDLHWYFHATHGYAVRNDRSGARLRQVYLHRVVLPTAPGLQVDHIDGVRLNNRRANLRPITRAQQQQNRGKASGKTSRYRGVSWDSERRKWFAKVEFQGKQYALGRYVREEDAAAAARTFRLAHMPFTNEARAVADV